MEVSGQLHAPAALPPGKETRVPIGGGWIGSRAVLDAVVKRKIPSPRRESNPRTPIIQPVAQRYTDWNVTVLIKEDEMGKKCVQNFSRKTRVEEIVWEK
jgi:hypothetical protein